MYLFVGNYGVNCDDFEFINFVVKGVVVCEVVEFFFNWCN